LAEQFSLLDNLGKGRLIVGIGKGTNYNIYEYDGYGIDPAEAQARYEEAEQLIVKAWTGEDGFSHEGKFWQVSGPALRPRPYTKPHPPLLRAASSDQGAMYMGRSGVPFLMNAQSDEQTLARLSSYKTAMTDAGFDEEHVAKCMSQTWIWRNVYVGENDKEAKEIGIPNFTAMIDHRAATRERVAAEQGKLNKANPVYRNPDIGLVAGSSATVAERMHKLASAGVGGVMVQFKLGPMEQEIATASMRRFAKEVMPEISNISA
jgi:alkanesulfonate monooxygenase SsuD/methylene tetrahydromethanopterin reductase-like flavin-dependent oxidoreductase (luciferase family)